jgi:hypothetical protein
MYYIYYILYNRWPNVLVQFEDFQNERAVALLNLYRYKYLCFNDDIQGILYYIHSINIYNILLIYIIILYLLYIS